jgi:DNA-binding transcriptional ArsR family regulator
MDQEIPLSKDVMKAVSEETRTSILHALERRPMTASEISRALGKHVTTIAQHMAMLEGSKLVERNARPGRKWVYYKLTKHADDIMHPKNYYKFVVILTAAVVLMSGALFASGSAMPGDLLYPVKRGVEGVRVLAATDSAQRSLVHLEIADERLDEAKVAAAKNDTEVVKAAAVEYGRELDAAKHEADDVGAAAQSNTTNERAMSALEAVDESTSKHITTLENLANRHHGAEDEIGSALNHTREVHEDVDKELSEHSENTEHASDD